ncbi:hypothetical protein QV08_04080 [Gallibacterium salpingitidis]|uniref:YdgA family protein n=1 Tax=Gallibacterium salpingitidis TaxID=505341 RepID=UPI000804ACC1|nr:DUF945 family protein [Gallibacterium salpingitidis]OBX08625.1 hypothetical protein QV08_04080 [Gallibacterium salpingitidis]
MQKKRFILPALIIVLGGIWAGSAWYTGTEIEKNYASTIEKINQNSIAKIENVQLDRHIFSTDMQYQLTVGKASFPMHTVIYHGPFPLNLVSHFNFVPQASSSQTTLQKTAETEPLFAAFAEKTPFLLDLNLGYQQQIQADLLINSGKVQNEETTANWQESRYTLDMDGKKAIKATFNIPHIDLNVVTKHNLPVKLLIEQFDLNADLQSTDWKYLPTGKITSSLKLLQTTEANGDKGLIIAYKDQVGETNLIKQDDFYSIQSTNKVGDFSLNGQSLLSQQDSKIEFNHLQGEAIIQWIDALLNDDKAAASQAATTLFDNQPQFVLNPLHLANSDGRVDLVTIITPEKNTVTNLNKGDADNFFSQLTIKLTFDKAFQRTFTETLIKQLNESTNPQQRINSYEIQQMIERELQSQVKQGVLVETDKSYLLYFEQKDGEFYLNQQKVPKEALLFGLLKFLSAF